MRIHVETKSTIREFTVEVEGLSPLSFSRHYDKLSVPKMNDKESDNAYEIRTWRNRLHFNKEGECYVPPTCIKNSLVTTAQFLGLKIPGKGSNQYAKHFERGILVNDPVMLGVHRDKVPCETYFVPSDGKKGGSKRVLKNFPVIQPWKGIAKVMVIDDEIPNEIFARVFHEAGRFNGWGRFRPQTGGFYGRFICKSIDVEEAA